MGKYSGHSTSGEVDALAVIGMDIYWQDVDGLAEFMRRIYSGQSGELSSHLFQPGDNEVEASSRSFQAALLTARRAWQDSGQPPGGAAAVLILAHSLTNEPSDLAANLSHRLGLNGPAEVLTCDQYSLVDALQRAARLIKTCLAEIVLLIEVFPGSGAAALALAAESTFSSSTQKPYAWVRAAAECAPAFTEGITRTCTQALVQANAFPSEISYLEVSGAGSFHFGEEMAGILPVYPASGAAPSCALGQMIADMTLLPLIKVVLCLSNRFLPGQPAWQPPYQAQSWSASTFFVPAESRAWFSPSLAPRRKAAVSIHDAQERYTHLILEEAAAEMRLTPRPLSAGGPYLFLLTGNTPSELAASLDGLNSSILQEADLLDASQRMAQAAQVGSQWGYCLALVGQDAAGLQREAGFALRGLPAAFEKNNEWQTPQGSYFTPQPQGRLGKVAFVYAGGFNSFVGLGRDLFYLFPGLHETIQELTNDVGASIREKQLYPRSLLPLTKDDLQAIDLQLAGDPVAMLTSGTTFGVLYTLILEEIFGIQPGAAFGYSLGENSLMYASGVWGNCDNARQLLETSPLFHTRLTGAQETIRQAWGMPSAGQGTESAPIWANYLLMCSPEVARQALQAETRVYMTHINTPRQVVIAGDPQSCQQVIARVGCTHLKMPSQHVMHCPPVHTEFEALRRLHDWPIQRQPDFPIYLSVDCQPAEINQAVLAEKIAGGLCTCVDFAGLTRRAYQDGVRVFIELGAGSNCSKWIDDTLREQPHLSAAINRPGTDDLASILRLLARLCSHRVPVDLSALFNAAIAK